MANDFSEIYVTSQPLVIPAPEFTGTAGAVLDFCGVVRGREGAAVISGLDYECYFEMAEATLRTIATETSLKYDLEFVLLVHRVGFVAAGEPSLFLRVTAAHREEAYQGSREIIERLKQEVPIWKKPVMTIP